MNPGCSSQPQARRWRRHCSSAPPGRKLRHGGRTELSALGSSEQRQASARRCGSSRSIRVRKREKSRLEPGSRRPSGRKQKDAPPLSPWMHVVCWGFIRIPVPLKHSAALEKKENTTRVPTTVLEIRQLGGEKWGVPEGPAGLLYGLAPAVAPGTGDLRGVSQEGVAQHLRGGGPRWGSFLTRRKSRKAEAPPGAVGLQQ